MTEVDSPDRTAKEVVSEKQLRPELWHTINSRYPGVMIVKHDFIPLAHARRPLHEARVTLVSSCGVHLKSERAMDVCHSFGDFTFRRVPSNATSDDLIIHQLKYPHDDADLDINVIFPIERLQEMVAQKVIGSTTPNFFSFIGYNMDPTRFERTRSATLSMPTLLYCLQLDRSAISPWDWFSVRSRLGECLPYP